MTGGLVALSPRLLFLTRSPTHPPIHHRRKQTYGGGRHTVHAFCFAHPYNNFPRRRFVVSRLILSTGRTRVHPPPPHTHIPGYITLVRRDAVYETDCRDVPTFRHIYRSNGIILALSTGMIFASRSQITYLGYLYISRNAARAFN